MSAPESTPDFPSNADASPPRWRRILVVGLCLAGYAVVHLWLAGLLIEQTNFTDKDLLGADQKHNLKTTLLTVPDLTPDWSEGVSEPLKQWLPHRTDGVLNPLWPWVAAWLADPEHPISGPQEITEADRAQFLRGKSFNVGLSLGCLILLGLACSRIFTLPATLNVVLLCGLGAWIPRAVYYQPEPLYYVFFTLTWIACIFALLRNSLWVYSLIGVFSGIAYLAKGSVHPLLYAFLGISTARWLWGWVLAHWPGKSGTTQWVRRDHLFGVFLLVSIHLLTISPRLMDAQQKFGDPFHSFPAYWMWFDDFPECYAWMGQYGHREALETLPDAEKPSFARYRSTHTGEEMWLRLRDGVLLKWQDLWTPGFTLQNKAGDKPWKGVLESRGAYLVALLLLLIGVSAWFQSLRCEDKHARQCLHPEGLSVLLFVLGSFLGYSLAYGWYSPIGRGDRFMLSLYAPLVISLIWACESVIRRAKHRKPGRALFVSYEVLQWALCATLLWRLVEIAQNPAFKN